MSTLPNNEITMEPLTLKSISKHLDVNVIDKVFKSKTNSEDSVKSVEVTRAAAPGEGMISGVYRIKVTGKDYTASFVAKGFVQDALLQKSLKCTILFKREGLFFSEILPVLIEIQKHLGGKERIQSNLPVCYKCHVDGKDDYILMEDLREKQFTSMSTYPTKNERDMTLKVLAHFHSVSLALRIKEPDVFTRITAKLNEVYYNADNRNWYAKYLQRALAIDKDVLAEIEGTGGIYYKKFDELVENDVYGQLIKLVSTRGDHPVLNHGDAWCPNFLCCNDKTIAIDFQLVRCASPATDLSYFLILCSNLYRNSSDFFEAIDVYYEALEYYLQDMGLDADNVFSFETLKKELQKYGKFGILAALTSIPLLASERSDVMQSLEANYSGCETIPLEELWHLTPMKTAEHKMRLVNAMRIAVDAGFI